MVKHIRNREFQNETRDYDDRFVQKTRDYNHSRDANLYRKREDKRRQEELDDYRYN